MNALPAPIALSFSFAVLTAAIGMIAVHTLLTGLASRRATLPIGVAAFLSSWLAAAIVFAAVAQTAPLPVATLRAAAAGISFLPLLVAIALIFTSRSFAELRTTMPPEWPIRTQVYRVLGFVFLYPLLAYGAVPAGFALPAAIGDMITGAFAVVVANAVARNRQGAGRWAMAWNFFGIADLIVAPAAAVLSGANVFTLPPLALIAIFLGPPLGILNHIWSLRTLAARGAATSGNERRSPSARRLSPHPEGSALS